VAVQGPLGLAEKPPCGELEVSVTVTGWVSGRVVPATCRRIVSGPVAVPAATVAAWFANTRAGLDHVEKSFQASLKEAPAMALVHDDAHAEPVS
jgi:hypothetical protein